MLDLDVRAFFDSVPHDLLLKAVAHHTDERWVLLYISRWLCAPMPMPDGSLVAREKGTPQGSPISPLLANLFMHYAFDRWMDREFPGCPFERYADDVVAHCNTEGQARALRAAIAERLGALGLELHPDKTKIVYCKDTSRRGTSEYTSFDFLGYTFRGRRAHGRRGLFVSFSPAMSTKAEEGERPTDQGLAPQPSQWHGPVRPRPGHQPPGSRLDQLLRGLLPLHVDLPSQYGTAGPFRICVDHPSRWCDGANIRKEPAVPSLAHTPDLSFVGLDVHRDTISVAILGPGREGADVDKISHDEESVRRLVARLPEPRRQLRACYEAGPTGYELFRLLRSLGVRCDVVAPSLIPKAPGDKVKTDKRDCRRLARLHRAGELVAIRVPDPTEEAVRDLCRTRGDMVEDLTRARNRLTKFLLRHGKVWRGGSNWTVKHETWLSGVELRRASTAHHLLALPGSGAHPPGPARGGGG